MRCFQFVGIAVLLLLDEGAPREIRRKRNSGPDTGVVSVCPLGRKLNGHYCFLEHRSSNTFRTFNNFHKKEWILENRMKIPSPATVTNVLHELDAREVDKVGSTVELKDNQEKFVRSNIALLVSDKLIRGLQVSSIGRNSFRNESFNFLNETLEPNSVKEIARNKESELVVILPPSVTKERRVSFVVFRNESLFRSKQIGYTVNSLVISVNIENVSRFDGEEVIDIYFRSIMKPAKNQSVTCAYWHFLEDDTGYWCQDGCTFIRATEAGMLDTCRCNHLTHFAELLVSKVVFTKTNENTLELLTIVGCSLSIMGLIVIGATALLFKSWRKKHTHKIWLNLCMAILVLDASFLLAIFVHYDDYHVMCLLLGVTLHYAVLASFCWMLVAAVLAYRQLVLVFSLDVPHMILKAAAFAWGAPVVVVGVILSVSKVSYAGRLHEMTPGGTFCYPTGLGLWLAVIAPILVILVTNWTLLALIIHSVFLTKKNKNYGERNEALRCISVNCTLVFLFGLPWVSGLFASDVVAAYLFTSTATFQGFILFIFFVIGNKETRNLWINKIFKKQK